MEDTKINELLNAEKYEDAIDFIKDKYVGLFSKMLDSKKSEKPINDDFYCYTTKVMQEYPELNIEINSLRKAMVNDEMSFLDEIELLKNTYNHLNYSYGK